MLPLPSSFLDSPAIRELRLVTTPPSSVCTRPELFVTLAPPTPSPVGTEASSSTAARSHD